MPEQITLSVALVFDDWKGPLGKPVDGETNIRLSTGDLHSGSTFQAEITLHQDAAEDLMDALSRGFQPVFWMGKRKDA